MRLEYRGLICILNSGDITIPQQCLDAFDWCQIQDDFFGTLNKLPRIPDMFIQFDHLPLSGQEIQTLPMFMRSKWLPPFKDFDGFVCNIDLFKERFALATTQDEYVVTVQCQTMRQWSRNVVEISPTRFLEMHQFDKPLNQMSHFWIDMTALACCDAGRKFISEYLPAIRKYKPLAAMYHDATFEQKTTRELTAINTKRNADLLQVFFKEKILCCLTVFFL